MQLRKNLNINNTHSSGNLNPFVITDDYIIIDKHTKFSNFNFDSDKTYVFLYDEAPFCIFQKIVAEEYPHLIIITSKNLPKYLAVEIGSNHNASILYDLNKHNAKYYLDNIKFFSEIMSTGFFMNFDFEANSLNDILFNMYDVRYYIDRLCILGLNYNHNMQLYSEVHEILARWKTQLWLEAKDLDESYYMKKTYHSYI